PAVPPWISARDQSRRSGSAPPSIAGGFAENHRSPATIASAGRTVPRSSFGPMLVDFSAIARVPVDRRRPIGRGARTDLFMDGPEQFESVLATDADCQCATNRGETHPPDLTDRSVPERAIDLADLEAASRRARLLDPS